MIVRPFPIGGWDAVWTSLTLSARVPALNKEEDIVIGCPAVELMHVTAVSLLGLCNQHAVQPTVCIQRGCGSQELCDARSLSKAFGELMGKAKIFCSQGRGSFVSNTIHKPTPHAPRPRFPELRKLQPWPADRLNFELVCC